MKRIFLALIFAAALAVSARGQAPSTCTVSGTLYNPDATAAAGALVRISKVTKNGVLIAPGPFTYTANGSGVVSFNIIRGTTAYIYSTVAPFNVVGGIAVAIPNTATADLSSLATVASVPTAGINVATLPSKEGTLTFDAARFTVTEPTPGSASIALNFTPLADPMTTRGDIIYRNASNVSARLPLDTANKVLFSNGTDLGYSQVTNAMLAIPPVNSGTTPRFAYYAGSGTAVSDTPGFTYVASGQGIAHAGSAVSGGATLESFTPGAHTGVTSEVKDYNFAAHTMTITGGFAIERSVVFDQPTISAATSLTVGNAATVSIVGPPIAAGAGPAIITNPYALRVESGNTLLAGKTFGGNANGTNDWLTTMRPGTTDASQISGLATAGHIGVIGGSRSSDAGACGQCSIGVSGFANNDDTTGGHTNSVYAGYFEVHLQSGATGPSSLGIEIDSVNHKAAFASAVNPYTLPSSQQIGALWLGSGGGDGVAGSYGALVRSHFALGIINNFTTFDKGIVFGSTSLARVGDLTGGTGTGVAEAISMPLGHELHWYNADGTLRSTHGSDSIFLGRSTDDTASSPNILAQVNGYNVFGLESNHASGSPIIAMFRSLGTNALKTSVATTNIVGDLQVRPYDGTNFVQSGDIQFAVDGALGGTVTAGHVPTYISFQTMISGGALGERMRITNNGIVSISNTTYPATWSTAATGALRLGQTSIFAGNLASSGMFLSENGYRDNTTWKAVQTGGSTNLNQTGTSFTFYTAPSVAADAALSYTAAGVLGPGLQLGAPTGGDKGIGTLNVAGGIYQNGAAIGTGVILGGSANGVNFNSANTDTAITITSPSTNYYIWQIVIENTGTTASLTTATYGIFTSTGGGGTAIVNSGTALSAITSSTVGTNGNLLIKAPDASAYWNNATIQFRIVTAQGAAASGNVYVYIRPLP